MDPVTHVCSVTDCTNPVHARGWYVTHYHRWYRHGSLAIPASRMPNPGPCAVDGCTRSGPFSEVGASTTTERGGGVETLWPGEALVRLSLTADVFVRSPNWARW
jgi:hypothetical protein